MKKSLFTPEELAEFAAFDAEVDASDKAQKLAEKRRRYYEANKDEIAEYQRRYYEANKDEIAEKQRRYRKANKEKINERRRQKRNAAKGAAVHDG